MEEVLDVYTRPEDPDCPLVCMDEASKQLVGETRLPLPARPGDVAHYDYEDVRNGVATLFMFFAPLAGWRHIQVTERRTRVDWVYAMRGLVDVYFPQAVKIRVVCDNLNTHAPGSLYEAFAPEEARRRKRQDSERKRAVARTSLRWPLPDGPYAACSTAHTSPQRSWNRWRCSAKDIVSFMC